MLHLPPRPDEERIEPVDDLEQKAKPVQPQIASLEMGQLVKEDMLGVLGREGI
jgi:hypothetical protein